MLEEAQELFESCKRYDLLNDMLQACGDFEEALSVAEKHDRINLKNTHLKYAQFLESKDEIEQAIVQ